jgi:putative membrane protein
MKRIFQILTVASFFAMYSCNEARREQDQDTNEVAEEANDERFDENEDMEKDADFVAEAVASDMAEIKMAQLASQRSTNPQIKEVAKMLETEHTKTLNELKALAQTKAITVPMEEKEDAKDKYKKLSEVEADEFDKKWLEHMEDDHEKCINKFEKRAENGEDAEIKAFAAKTLPHLKMHKEKIESVQESMKDNDKNDSASK